MDELDEELLDLVGASNKPKRPAAASKTQKGKKTSNGKRKKRRKRSSDSESSLTESDFEAESASDDSSLFDDEDLNLTTDGEDEEQQLLALNDYDEEELEGMTEFQREELYAERAEKRQQLLEKLEIKKRLKADSAKRKTRSSEKGTKKTNKKLEELKQRRSGKAAPKKSYEYEEESENEEDYRDRIRSTYASSGDASMQKGRVTTLEEMDSIRISRDQLEKLVYKKDFPEVAHGCFVRLGIGAGPDRQQAYRICQIVDVVDYHKTYKLNGTVVKKALELKHGKAQKVFLMDIISNGPFTEQEYNRWVRTMQLEKQRFPSIGEIKSRREALQQELAKTLTSAEIDFMIKEKQKLGKVEVPAARQKLMLLTQKQLAIEQERHDELASIDAKLRHLDGHHHNGSGGHASNQNSSKDIWAKLNERNRQMNREESAQAERLAKLERRSSKVAADPFARIKAISTHVFVTPGPQSANSIVSPTELPSATTAATTPSDGQSANNSGHVTPKEKHSTHEATGDAFEDVLADVEIDI